MDSAPNSSSMRTHYCIILSRWFKCLKTLGSSVSDSDYFHELKMRRLQKVRGVVWDLFQAAEAGGKDLETNQILSESKVIAYGFMRRVKDWV